ncbi:hypothetical protein ACX1C1_02735 [Paenibacillus sp. strain BS8-2]
MKPENLIYTFVSYAAHYDTDWGKGVAIEGIDRTAAVAHRHGIPVTWIVNSGSVPVLASRINEWHEQYGDDIILQTPFFIEDCGADSAKFKAALVQAWTIVEAAFPWASTKVAARGKIYNEVIEVLEELDFKGMWGYCWEQVWWDGITHKGIPWGSWYIDPNRYKAPHPGKGKVVACEWTARDLNLTYHSRSPVIYSTDPNDVLRAGLCTGDNIDYWKNLFMDYLRNTSHNDQVFFLQQQEAHEMEYTDRFAVFPASHVEACESMLDLFFDYITDFPITLTTVPKAMERYHERNSETAPVYMLTQDTLVRPAVNEYTMTLGGVGGGPWPDVFLYYDKVCQMAFVDGECIPRLLRNYIGKGNMADNFEEATPGLFVKGYEKTLDRIALTYEIGYTQPMPFGLAYWDELDGFEVISCSEGVETKLIEGRLVFLKFQLTGEPRKLELVLARKRGL